MTGTKKQDKGQIVIKQGSRSIIAHIWASRCVRDL